MFYKTEWNAKPKSVKIVEWHTLKSLANILEQIQTNEWKKNQPNCEKKRMKKSIIGRMIVTASLLKWSPNHNEKCQSQSVTWINVDIFLDPFSISVTFSRIDSRAEIMANKCLASCTETEPDQRTIGNYEVENDTRVPKYLSMTSAFDATLALDYTLDKKGAKNTENNVKKSR